MPEKDNEITLRVAELPLSRQLYTGIAERASD